MRTQHVDGFATRCEVFAKASHLVASLSTSRQQDVFALLAQSCQQVWNKLLKLVTSLLALWLVQHVRYSHDGLSNTSDTAKAETSVLRLGGYPGCQRFFHARRGDNEGYTRIQAGAQFESSYIPHYPPTSVEEPLAPGVLGGGGACFARPVANARRTPPPPRRQLFREKNFRTNTFNSLHFNYIFFARQACR